MSTTYRVVKKYTFVIEVIEDILRHSATRQTTLIVCSTQDEFLRQLAACIEGKHLDTTSRALTTRSNVTEIPASQEDIEYDAAAADEQPPPAVADSNHHPTRAGSHHPLIQPILHQLSSSRNVQVAFCPTITTFRAYIAVFHPTHNHHHQQQDQTQPQDSESIETTSQAATITTGTTTNAAPPPAAARLVILDLITLHHGTSEFTIQGLSRTLSRTASTALHNNMTIALIECQDVFDQDNPNRGSRLWDAPVPLLSGSVKISAAGASWAGRTVEINKLARRWFSFE